MEQAEKITVKELDELHEKIFAQRDKVEEFRALASEQQKLLDQMESQLATALKELGRTSYKSPYGSARIKETWNFKMPADPESKAKFFDFLRERGLFDQYATVNYQSLNSFCRAEKQAAEERGDALNFSIPGVGDPSLYETVTMTREKGDK